MNSLWLIVVAILGYQYGSCNQGKAYNFAFPLSSIVEVVLSIGIIYLFV